MSTGLLSSQIVDTTSRDPFVPWTRPTDWLPITDPVSGDQKIVMLWAIWPSDQNYFTITCSGAYSIDWGDGTAVTNTATATQTSKQLLWSSYSGSTLTSRGYRQAIITVTPQAGQTLTSIAMATKHASVTNGYCTGLLDIVTAGQNVTAMNMVPSQTFHGMMERWRYVGTNQIVSINTAIGGRNDGQNGIPSLRTVAATNGQGYDIWTASATSFSAMFCAATSLEYGATFGGGTSGVVNASYMYYACSRLQSVPLFNTSSVTSMSQMFQLCGSLKTVPAFDTTACTQAANMFTSCGSLQTLPSFNWSSCINLNNFASSCGALTSIGSATGGSSGNTMLNAFNACASLTSVPDWDYSKTTTFSSAFAGCVALRDATNLDSTTALLTVTGSMFSNCYSLNVTGLPSTFNTSGVVDASLMFSGCRSLTTIPTPSGNNWKFSACTNMSLMFQACTALQTLPMIDTSACTNMGQMLQTCTALVSVPGWNVANVTNFLNMFQNDASLQSAPLVGARFAISFASCSMNAAALDAIYTGLGTASGSQTITVTGNPGTTGDTPSIATGKGWTVAGS